MPPRFFFWREGGPSPLKGENRMENMDLIEHIQQKFPRMSKGQKAIATFIMENYDKAAFMTASRLGKKVGVSESTVVRFAAELGYDGYPDMQKSLQKMIRNRLTSVQRIEVTNDRIGDQDLVSMVVQKAVKMAQMMNIPIVGLVENMSYVQCPDCGKKLYIFGEGKTEEAAKAYHIPLLAKMPIDPALAKLTDDGCIEQFEGHWLDSVVETILRK